MYTPSSFSPPPLEGLCCLPPPEGQQVLFSSCSGPRSRLRSSVMIFFFFFLLLLFFVSFSFSSIPTLDLPTYLPSFFYFSLSLLLLLFPFSQNAAGVIPTTVPTSGGPLRLLYMCGAIKNPSRYVQVIKKRERERRDWLPSLSSSKIRSFPFFLFFSSSSYSPHFLKVVSRDAIGATSL